MGQIWNPNFTFFKSLKNFLEKTFVHHSESDTNLLIRIDRNIVKLSNPLPSLTANKEILLNIFEFNLLLKCR